MDPDATWHIVASDNYALSERAEAANDLLRWIGNGGFPPVKAPGRAAVLEQCHTIIVQLIEAHDDMIETVM
jgi:hypothetical protein